MAAIPTDQSPPLGHIHAKISKFGQIFLGHFGVQSRDFAHFGRFRAQKKSENTFRIFVRNTSLES